MKKLWALALLGITLAGCQEVKTEQTTLPLSLSGEMLFSGANTLQMPAENDLETLAQSLQIGKEQITDIGVAKAQIMLTDAQAQITESLLLQIVSNQQELTTIGTLNPLPEANTFSLSLAEEIDLKPYFSDDAPPTYVLDLNLSEDFMDEMVVKGELTLDINYNP
jgi:Neuraminidase (sialidase)